MTRKLRSLASLRGLATLGGVLVCFVAIATSAKAATATPVAQPAVTIYHVSDLLPGDILTGQLVLPAGSTRLTPYLEALRITDGCVSTCSSDLALMSTEVRLVVTAPSGETWRGTPADLRTAQTLPGGQLPAHSAARIYTIALTLPESARFMYAGRTLGIELQWGGMSAAGRPVTKVLGETFGRGAGETATPPDAPATVLPFTGSNVLAAVAIGLLLLCTGLLLTLGLAGHRSRKSLARSPRAGAHRRPN